MSEYQANIVIKNPATPTGPSAYGSAPGMWKLNEVAYWIKQGVWPNPAIVPDTYFPYVSLLLSTTSLSNANNNLFVDSSGAFNPVSRNGNTTQGSFTPYATNWSNYFDGTDDEVLAPNTPANFGSSSFTAECWVMFTTNTIGYQCVMGNQGTGDGQGWIIYTETNNRLYFAYSTGGGWAGSIDTGVTPSVGVWTHLAVVRNGTAITFYVNGVASGTPISTASAIMSPSGNFRIGRYPYFPGGARTITAWISNVRLVNGTAVYTGNFTPPTSALTAITNTSLLTCQSNRFRDASSNNYTITIGGNPSVQDFSPFSPAYPGASYNQSDITNWSGFFNGGTDRVQVPVTSNMYLGTTYTIEAWAYYNSTSYGARPIFSECEAFQGGFAGLTLTLNTSGNLVAEYRPATSGAVTTITGPTVTPYTWFHIALVSNNSSAKLYVNGTQVGSTTTFGDYPSAKTAFVAVGSWGHGWNDGGIPAAAWIGYISNMRVVKGVAVYTSNFTPSTTPLTAISGTVLLTCQNAAFTDNSSVNNILTPVSNATVTGNSPFNTVGYWSNYFDASGDYQRISSSQVALQFGTGDFTIEGWAYSTGATGTYQQILTGGSSWTSGSGGVYWYYNGGSPYIGAAWNQIATNPAVNSGTLATNTWHHFAVVRSGNTLTLYINGSSVDTLDVTGVSMAVNNQSQTNIGGGGWDQDFGGYLSNLRVVKGTAVYTSNFTVPTTPLTAITNTSLLVCQSSRFIDSSTNAFTLVPAGNVAVQSFDPFYTATIASNGGSMYFDGTGDYLNAPTSPAFGMGTSDFTIEGWIYPTTNVGNGPGTILDLRSGPTASATAIRINTSLQLLFYNGPANTEFVTGTVSLNTWTHIAFVRSSGSLKTYINGVLSNTTTVSSDLGSSQPCLIGANQTAGYNFYGYISNFRITKGTAVYTSAFTPPTAPLTPSANTTLLVNGMNAGIYDATTINDMETVGNAQVRYPSPFAPADYWGGYFNGSNWLNVADNTALDFGTGDFTVECWVNFPVAPSGDQVFVAGWTAGEPVSGWTLTMGTTGFSFVSAVSASYVVATNTADRTAGVWHHVAAVRSSGSVTVYVNGVGNTPTSNTQSINTQSSGLDIARSTYTANRAYYTGSISNLRIVKGTAVYTSNFTPPTSPLTAITNTSLLTCQNKTFIDNSTNAFTITSNGSPTAGAIGPFTATGGTSMYFDGTGDYLVPNGMQGLGSGDFTVEFWMYPNSSYSGAYAGILDTGGRPGAALVYVGYTSTANQIGWYQGTSFILTASVTQSTWQHVAITRASGTIRMFVNGTLASSTTTSENYTVPFRFIGSSFDGAAYNGYLDDLRLTRGVARYTSNFTPPTQAFPVY